MKKIALILILLRLGVIYSFPQDSIVSIPDTAFLYALIDEGVDANKDIMISYSEAGAKTQLNLHDKGITDITGIEAFINLETLDCNLNKITSLDLSDNERIETLDCGGNLLTSLDLSRNKAIRIKEGKDRKPGEKTWPALVLNNMPSLCEVCVWITFNPDSIDIDTAGSPNVCFETDCNGVFENTEIEEYSKLKISVYPNPAKNHLTIETGNSNLVEIHITSLNGQRLLHEEMKGSIHQIDLSSFQKGIYVITVRSEGYCFSRKIIRL